MVRTEVLERKTTGISERHESDFRIEYGKDVPDQVLFNDVVSYLGEYRFNLPKFSYELKYFDGKLRDPHRLESMEDLAQRAINLSIQKGKFSAREQAEKLAFQKLDRKLKSVKAGDTIVWVSLPGRKEEGYGDYGFVYFGKVGENYLYLSDRTIKLTAVRIENPTIEQANKVASLLTSTKIDYQTAEDFLANPHVLLENLSEEYVDSVLKMFFSFKPNVEAQKKFELIIRKMSPLISDFIQSAKNPWKTKTNKIKELHSLENYALKLKREYEESIRQRSVIVDFKPTARLTDIVREYGYEPPKVAGSCPSKNSTISGFTSSNAFSKGSILNSIFGDEIDYEFDQPGPCKKCGAMEVECGPCGICRSCDMAIREVKNSA